MAAEAQVVSAEKEKERVWKSGGGDDDDGHQNVVLICFSLSLLRPLSSASSLLRLRERNTKVCPGRWEAMIEGKEGEKTQARFQKVDRERERTKERKTTAAA